jgi:hypothetical protein
MSKSIVSVFYSAGPGCFFQSRTDFFSREDAEIFIGSRFFTEEGFVFYFMLLNGTVLLKGSPQENTAKYFSAAMEFAVDIPKEEFGYR